MASRSIERPGWTDTRIVGALFLACAVITISTLVARGRLFDGLRFVLIVLGMVTLARIYGLIIDGPAPATVAKLRNELILLAVFGASVFLERNRPHIPEGGSHEITAH